MTIDAVSNLFSKPATGIEANPIKSQGLSFTTFLNQTNNELNTADKALQELAAGHATNLHQVMLKLEQAKLSFQYLEQIRNRLMSAYQEILREQI